MDDREDLRRPRGHAYLADQARRALVLPHEIHELADVPVPLVHTAFGMAVCAIAVLCRPQAVGLRTSAIAGVALAAATLAVFTLYDQLVYDPEVRPGIDGAALPVAAIAAFLCVMGGSPDLRLRLVAAGLASLIIGGVPHLSGLRAAGREGMGERLLRDGAGVAVLLPVMVVGFSPALPWWSRGGLVLVCVVLVTFDSLRTEGMPAWVALAAAIVAGWMVASAAALATAAGTATDARAPALLLVLWYAVRGLTGAVVTRPRRPALVAEYLLFAAIAAVLLEWIRR